MQPIRVSVISYLNTLPFRYGIEHSALPDDITVTYDVPSSCARRLIDDEADIGIVPVAMIPSIPGARVETDFCLGADGPVETVLMVSNTPIKDIRTIWRDPDSRSSVAMAKLLSEHYWKQDFIWDDLPPGFRNDMPGGTAAVIIGDKAFNARGHFRYIYDLGKEWKDFTGLPFVFACWVANKPLPHEFLEHFSQALSYGVNHVHDAIKYLDKRQYPGVDVARYLTRVIGYHLDERKKQGKDMFLRMITGELPF